MPADAGIQRPLPSRRPPPRVVMLSGAQRSRSIPQVGGRIDQRPMRSAGRTFVVRRRNGCGRGQSWAVRVRREAAGYEAHHAILTLESGGVAECMSRREDVLESLSKTIADYRDGEVGKFNASHVEKWSEQFDTSVRLPILEEMDYVLKQTYLPKSDIKEFLSALVVNDKLTNGDPRSYWQSVKLLNIQGGGASQVDMLEMFGDALDSECRLTLSECSGSSGTFVYLDDGIYTGNRILTDLKPWIQSDAPDRATLNIIVIVLHRSGQYYAETELNKTSRAVGKTISIKWWRCLDLEDRKSYTDSADVLRPVKVPNDQAIQKYVASLTHPVQLRKPGSFGKHQIFSSEEGRHLLEQEFLKAGCRIREMCPSLNKYQRPLGNSVLETLGFGSLVVTFRNCPNNSPLVLWVGNPWYPLFPRKANR